MIPMNLAAFFLTNPWNHHLVNNSFIITPSVEVSPWSSTSTFFFLTGTEKTQNHGFDKIGHGAVAPRLGTILDTRRINFGHWIIIELVVPHHIVGSIARINLGRKQWVWKLMELDPLNIIESLWSSDMTVWKSVFLSNREYISSTFMVRE